MALDFAYVMASIVEESGRGSNKNTRKIEFCYFLNSIILSGNLTCFLIPSLQNVELPFCNTAILGSFGSFNLSFGTTRMGNSFWRCYSTVSRLIYSLEVLVCFQQSFPDRVSSSYQVSSLHFPIQTLK
ncbi:MAG: hypothetical protein AMDU5_GPLC00009G0007 [Thermoplasmatales archaeon Gpl]|nr:MAG: hypothetical protein AMDU5_GPLC00009G0007 [Thermoplasmatales archaeon Gpl]